MFISSTGRRATLLGIAAVACAFVGAAAFAGPADKASQPPTKKNPNIHQLPPSVQRDLAAQQPLGSQPPAKGPPQIHGVPPAQPTATVQLKPGEAPKIEFDMPVYDFGRIKAGENVVHDFWFTNVGTGPLEITQVKPS